jgi:hypothetical protein
MKVKTLAAMLVIVAALLLVAGCAKKECEVASDCGSNTQCITHGCSAEGKCMKNVKPNCCGNFRCELSAGENSCGCGTDCGQCAGKVKYNTTTSKGVKTIETKYSVYACNDAKDCVVSANPDLVTELKLTNVVEERNYFKLDLLSTLNKPFDTATDKLSVRVTLSDLSAKTVSGGLTVTSIQVLSGNTLMGEAILNRQLVKVGDAFTQEFTLETSQTLPEEDMQVSLKVFYSYLPLDSRGQPLQVKRSSQTVVISSTKIPFIKP